MKKLKLHLNTEKLRNLTGADAKVVAGGTVGTGPHKTRTV